MSAEPTRGEFHEVGDAEADAIVEALGHAIPHNEWLGRLLRNMYPRLQVLEKENKSLKKELAELKAKKSKRSVPP